MEFDMTEVVVALIGLLSTVITCFLVPLLKKKMDKSERELLATLIKTAVYAAEQVFNGTKLGKDKKDYVFRFLKEQGIDVEDEKLKLQINNLIESFVAEINGKTLPENK